MGEQDVHEYLLVAAALTAVFLVLALQVAGKVGSVAGNAVMESVMTLDSVNDLGVKVGDKVTVAVKAVNVLLFKE